MHPQTNKPNRPPQDLKASLRSLRRNMDQHGAAMLSRWLLSSFAIIGVIAFIPSAYARIPLALLGAGYLQRLATSGILHESFHGTFFSNRKLSDALARTLAALVLIDYDQAKTGHFGHHAHLATKKDPELIDMKRYGLKPKGMSQKQILFMLARTFHPRHIAQDAVQLARLLVREPHILVLWSGIFAAAYVIGSPALLIAGSWVAAALTTRRLLWLMANSTEHDFVLASEIEQGSTAEGRRLAKLPIRYRWLALSRERHGWWFKIVCPESEKLWHGDHHAEPALPGAASAPYVAMKIAADPIYRRERKVVAGLFRGNEHHEAAYASLMRGRESAIDSHYNVNTAAAPCRSARESPMQKAAKRKMAKSYVVPCARRKPRSARRSSG